MLTAFIGFITSKVAGPIATAIAALLAAALLFVWISSTATESSLRSDLKTANASLSLANINLSTCKANTATLAGALAASNKSVDDLHTASDAATKAANDKLSAAAGQVKAAQSKADSILAAKPDSTDVCKSADDLILESLN